jgi:peptide/nickel transport system permease protein
VTRTRRLGGAIFTLLGLLAIAGPAVVAHDPAQQFADLSYAPPMPLRVLDASGHLQRPFFYPLRLVNRLEHRFEEDRTRPTPLRWSAGHRMMSRDSGAEPWLPLGGDPLGRDMLARVLLGSRLSLGVSLAAAVAAMLLGGAIGALAGFNGGSVDDVLMGAANLVLVLPVIYVLIVLRGAMPLVLSPWRVFWTLAGVLALAGWPYPARGVRAIVARERTTEYAEAARAIGAGPWRILLRHLLPASRDYLGVQLTLLLPVSILAEATLSFVGFGFAEPAASWGLMLQDAAQAGALVDAPWLMAPAGAIVLSVFSLHLLAGGGDRLR